MKETDVTVVVGDGVVTVKRSGSSAIAMANILGTANDGEYETIYLDRLVHKPYESKFTDFTVHGAISTILLRKVPLQ